MATPARFLQSLGTIAASGGGDTSSFESIETYSVSSAQSSITFSNIPQTFKHLQLRVFSFGTTATAYDSIIRVNGDSGTNYAWHDLYGDGANTGARGSINTAAMYVNTDANRTTYPNVVIIDVLDYANTSKHKTFRNLTGIDVNGGGAVSIKSGHWRSTSAITSLTITVVSANFDQYSHFALYGIRG